MPPFALPLAVAVGVALAAAVAWLFVSHRRLAAKLVSARRLFGESMNLAPFCAYIKDSEGRYCYVNPAFVAITRKNMPHAMFLGSTDLELFPADHARQYMDDDQKVLRLGKPIAFDNSSVDAEGIVHQWFSVKFPWIDEHGRTCVGGISVDTSEVERAQATAKASDARCAVAIEAGRMGTFTLDLATRMLDTSPLFATLHGRPESKTQMCIEESLTAVHPDDHMMILATIQAALDDRAPSRITYRVMKPEGGVRWIELMGQVFSDETGRPTVVHGVGFDVTDSRIAYEELALRKDILRRLIDIQENERQTLCHELHDGLIQYAIGAKMLLEGASIEADEVVRGEQIDAAIDSLQRGIAEGRQVIRGVRPTVLDDLGLTAAIEDLADHMATGGVAVETTLGEGLDSLPPSLCTTIYRVIQEALANARKHAGIDRATVTVRCTGGEVHVRVRDHGTGFEVNGTSPEGFGIVGMTERVRLAGGMLWVESQTGSGTKVNARLPIPADDGESPTWRTNAPAAGAEAAR